MIINRNIKKIRQLSGLTQAKFAHDVGINLASLKNYENTDVCPKLAVVINICKLSGLTPEQLRDTEINPVGINFCLPGLKGEDEPAIPEPEPTEVPKALLDILQSNDDFFKSQYTAFSAQVLANLSLLIKQSKKLENLALVNLTYVQNIARRHGTTPFRTVKRKGQKI